MEKNVKIMQRVYEHAEYVEKDGGNNIYMRVFTALAGSQNYGLADEKSDIDTKTLVIPTFEAIMYEHHINRTLLVPPSIEHAEVKDVRDMFACFRKQNINFLEILFTPYVSIGEGFEYFYSELWNKREDIAHLNLYQGLRTMLGHMNEKDKKFDHITPVNVHLIEKHGYDPKQLSHMLRIQEFLIRFYEDGDSYEDCLKVKHPEDLLAIKRGSLSYEYACALREDAKAWSKEFLDKWGKILPNKEDEVTRQFMNDLLLDVFQQAYKIGV